jgi:hypothetical protein
MRHPTEGVLRRLIDEPVGVAEPDRQHIAECAHCLGELATMRQDATLVGAALHVDGGADVDVPDAWRRLSKAAPTPSPNWAGRPARAGRARALLRRPIVAAVVVTAVLAGAGTAAANGWLQIFQTEKIAPVSINPGDLMALPDLSAYGDAVVTTKGDLHQVADAAAAAAETGLDVPQATVLPQGVAGEPAYQAGGTVTLTFTFSAERAAQAAAAAGTALPPVPAGLDGSQVQLTAGPGLAMMWSQPGGIPTLIVGRAVAPKVYSSGVPFETVRDYLLSLPGLSPTVAAQLRAFTADGSTLPLPVPADQVTTSSAEVNGVSATVLSTRDRTMAAVVWVKDGVLTAVAGALDTGEVLAVARNLR